MKKLLIASSALIATLSLAGCNTMNDASQLSNQTVGQGFKYTAHAVGTGMHVVADTGAAVGKEVGTVADTGMNLLTGKH